MARWTAAAASIVPTTNAAMKIVDPTANHRGGRSLLDARSADAARAAEATSRRMLGDDKPRPYASAKRRRKSASVIRNLLWYFETQSLKCPQCSRLGCPRRDSECEADIFK